MISYKNLIDVLVFLLLLGIYPVFMGHSSNDLLPVNENTTHEETFSKLLDKDIHEKNSFLFTYSLSDYTKHFFLITFFLPITFYLIRLLANSSRIPRLPPAH